MIHNNQQSIAQFLEAAGFEGDFHLDPLAGGANNRVFRVEVGETEVLLKAYFHHPNDPRARLDAEFEFSVFAWANRVHALPQPLARDPRKHLGLYEFIKGRQLAPHEVTAEAVDQALAFFCAINQYKRLPRAKTLPAASEACFSLAEHFGCVERRLQSLHRIDASSDIDREAAHFIKNVLSEVWKTVRDDSLRQSHEHGVVFDEQLNQRDWCLSPSDFGFHNAILTPQKHLRFIDFEYAGWDDPAKLVCDFFCQVAVPVPMANFDTFARTVVSGLSDAENHLQRIALLMPVYQVKWCCILLNNFLAVGEARRQFAVEGIKAEEQKENQLRLARQLLKRVCI
ncbi:MAG: aminoglycoside phosphotransferase family protein [Candidatus Poribacteria bacterium]|nr:aminoglycoside phosphotransferase family protein [Candidatus Poribacteria bacterium]